MESGVRDWAKKVTLAVKLDTHKKKPILRKNAQNLFFIPFQTQVKRPYKQTRKCIPEDCSRSRFDV
jgi:hypothetical protein